MPYRPVDLTIEQTMPVPLGRVIVLSQKMGDMRLVSAQMTEQREMPAEGQNYMVGQGPSIRAGERLSPRIQRTCHTRRCGLATWPSASLSRFSPPAGGPAGVAQAKGR